MAHAAKVVPIVTWRPETADHVRAKGMPLPELWDAVFKFVWDPGRSKKTNYNRRRTRDLSAALPKFPSPPDILAWMAALRAMGLGQDTVDHHRKNLAALYTYGGKLGLTSGNPAALVPHERPKGKPVPILDIETKWPRFLEVCKDDRERAWLAVLRFGGLRRGEALGLELDDVNTYASPWRIEVVKQRPDPNRLTYTPPKTETSCRYLPVREPLRELLAPVLAAGPTTIRVGRGGGGRTTTRLLFPYRGHDLADLGRRLRQVDPLAFPDGSKMWHALRDTLAVEFHRKGKTTSEGAAMLGHGSEYTYRTHYLSKFGREVNVDIVAGLDGPAPPGAGPPPDKPAAEKRTPVVAATGVQRRSKEQSRSPAKNQENTPCRTPTRNESSPSGSSRAASRAQQLTTSGPSSPSRPPAPKPGMPRSQRALPGLAAVAVTTRPARAAAATPAKAPRRR